MYFSKIELSQNMGTAERMAQVMCQEGYRLHQFIWDLFKDKAGQQRDFIYRRIEETRPCFYVVSTRLPKNSDGLWNIQTKGYVPKLAVSQHLAFSLCANPVIARSPDDGGKTSRHDVVMDAKSKLKSDGVPTEQWPSLPELIQSAGFKWLVTRAERFGFAVREGQIKVDGYQQHRLHKARQSRPIRFSTLEFNGVLTVVDLRRFQQALYEGIGPAKGFGCGLLMVKRV